MGGANPTAVFEEDGGLPLAEDLRDTVEGWLAHLAHERGATDNTLEAYERDLRQFLVWLKAELGHAPCLADLARLDAKRFRAFMAARRRAGLRRAGRWRAACRRCGRSSAGSRRRRSPATAAVLQVALPKVPHGIPKPLTVEKAAAVVDGGAAAELDWVAARDTAVLLLLYGSGLRISEALGLVRKDAPLSRPRGAAHHRQGRQGAAGAGAAHHAGRHCPLYRALPLSAGPMGRCSSAPRAVA